MKGNLSRMWRSGLSLLLALCLVVGMCPVAFATENEPKKYVSLGDSMANGYGLTGYTDVNGYLEESADAYPHKVAEYFGWNLTHQLAMSAMRAEDLHYILEYPNGYQGDYYTYDEFIDGRFKNDCNGVANAASVYQSAVAEADVISLGIGNANFGVFMLGRITNALEILGGDSSEDSWIEFQNALNECDAQTKATVTEAYNAIKAKILAKVPSEAAEQAEAIANAMGYAITSYVLNYAGVIDAIVNLNPNAEIIIVGLMNTMNGMKVEFESEGQTYTLDLGEVMNSLIGTMNAYLAAQPTVLQAAGKYPEATFYYAAASNVSMIVDNFAAEMAQATVTRDRTIEEVVYRVWPMLNAMTEAASDGSPYIGINRTDVISFEKALEDPQSFAAYAAQNSGKMQSVATYLAFEKATIEASKLGVLSGDAFITLAMGLDGVFNGVYENFYANLDAETAENAQHMAFAQQVVKIATQANCDDIYAVVALPDAMCAALCEEPIYSLLNVFARMLIGNGIGCHPSAAGHDTLTAAIVASYEANHTVEDETVENVEIVLEELYNLLETYGPEAAEQVWNALEEAGYVDYINESLSELQTVLAERYDNYVEVVIPTINASIEELTAQAESLKTELTALQAELAAKKAELENATGVAAEELETAIAKLEAAIASVEAAIAAVETNIADLQALVSELGTAAEQLKTQLTDLAAAAENLGASIAALMDVLEDTGISSVDALVSAYSAAKDAVVAAAEVLENAVAAADTLVEDIGEMAALLKEKINGLYEKVLADLEEAYNSLSDEEQAAVAEAIAAVQAALEEAKALVMEELEAALAALAEEYGPQIEAKKQELAALKQQIEDEIAAKYEEVKTTVETQLAELGAQAETLKAQLEELHAQLENGAEELQTEIAEVEAKLAELTAQLEELYAQLENASEELKAEIEAKIAELTAQAEELKVQLEELYTQLENASGELKAEIEARIAELENQLAAVEAQIAALQGELETALEAIRAEVEAAYAEAVAALENAIAELETAYNEAVEALKAAADAKIQELIAEAEAKLAELGEAGEAISAVIADIYAQVQEEIAAVNTAIEAILAGSIESVEDLAEAIASLAGETAEAIAAKVEETIAAVEAAFAAATTADLVIDDEFLYVALGDGSAVSESYVDKLAAALAEEAGISEITCVNEAYVGNTVANERENLSDVAEADLITIGFSNVTFLANTMQGKVNINWNSVVGEENVAYIDQLMNEVEAKIAENGLDAETSAYVSGLVEAYAYSAVEYATELPELINEIHAVNPEALVIIVGMYNPMEGVSIVLDENTSLNIGEYIDYLVECVAVHGVAYAMLTGNAIYVDARDVATNNTDAEITTTELVTMAMNGFAALYPNVTGHDSIAADVADALDVSYEQAEPAGLLGDAEGDMDVDNIDAMLVLQYYAGLVSASEIKISVCDVDGVNGVDNVDAMQILQYHAGLLDAFPVE